MKTKTLILSLVVLIFIASGMSQLEFRTENDIQSYSSFNMNGNSINNLNYQVFNNADTDFMRIYGEGEDPHTLRYDDRSLRFYNPSGGETMILDRAGNVRLPNGNLEVSSGDVDLNYNNLSNPNKLVTGGQNIQVWDSNNSQAIARFQEGGDVRVSSGNVRIPSGDLYVGNSLRANARGAYVQFDSLQNDGFQFRSNSASNWVQINGTGVSISSGDLDMNNNSVKGLPAPVDSNDAVRMQFVEDEFLDRRGDTMDGDLDMNDNNIDDIRSVDGGGDAVRVDDNLDLNGNEITSSNGEMCVGQYC